MQIVGDDKGDASAAFLHMQSEPVPLGIIVANREGADAGLSGPVTLGLPKEAVAAATAAAVAALLMPCPVGLRGC